MKYICKLNKSLYGLKQASRCWYETFVQHMSKLNFKNCNSDKSLYIGNVNGMRVYVVLLVDDGLVMSQSANVVDLVINHINKKFEISVCDPKTFVGMQIERNRLRKEIVFHQHGLYC